MCSCCRQQCRSCPLLNNCRRCVTCAARGKHVSPPNQPVPALEILAAAAIVHQPPSLIPHHRRSELDRWRIIVYYNDGQTIAQIAARIGCTRRTVYRWINAYSRNDVNDLKGNRGRKRKLSVSMIEAIVEHTKKIRFITPRDIKYFFDLDVCNRTIDRVLIQNSLFGRVARKRHPRMDPKKRLSFANGTKPHELIALNIMQLHAIACNFMSSCL